MRARWPDGRRWPRIAGATVVAVVCAACGQDTGAGEVERDYSDVVHVVTFSSLEPGWDATTAEFAATDGRGLEVEMGSSGDMVTALAEGKHADIAYLNDADDMAELVKADLVPDDWDNGTTGGYPFSSVVTMVVHPGNPRGIGDWPDLLQPGLEVVTPNPVRVGSGRWALLAAYAAASHGNLNPQAGHDYLRRLILEHVALGPSTTSQATEDFLNGRGDVLLVSEAYALHMVREGLDVEVVTPPETLRTDFALAITNDGLEKPGSTELAEFLFSPRGQQLWAEAGIRPSAPVPGVEFPTPQRLWTIEDLGGWDAVAPRYFGANGFITDLFEKATQ